MEEPTPRDLDGFFDLTPYVQGPARFEPAPDPLGDAVRELATKYDPGGCAYLCPVPGCDWWLPVPTMELETEQLVPGHVMMSARGYLREDVEGALAAHVDAHALLSETGAQDVPLAPEPVTS